MIAYLSRKIHKILFPTSEDSVDISEVRSKFPDTPISFSWNLFHCYSDTHENAWVSNGKVKVCKNLVVSTDD